MKEFTYEGYEFKGRQNEVSTIVWLQGRPGASWSLPRSFSFEECADYLLTQLGQV